jgi:hypothetical protein
MDSVNVYLLVGDDWDDTIVYLTEEAAIEASKKYPTMRVEILSRADSNSGYMPLYSYYKNGEYYE